MPDNAVIDSADYFNNDFTVTHIANEKRIHGKWNVQMMYRSSNSSAEKLSGVVLDFAGSQFRGKAPCNTISGSYVIKDFKISFSATISTKMACDKLDQESAYLKLLESRIDNFTFIQDKLVLKDSENHVVVECIKAAS